MSLLKPPKIARVPRVKPTPVSGWKRSQKVVRKGVVAPLIVKQMALYAKTRFKGEVAAPASTRRIEWTQNHLKSLRRAKNDKTKTPEAQRRALKRAQQKGHDLVASVMGVSSRSLQRRETDYNKGLLREPAVRGARELCKTSCFFLLTPQYTFSEPTMSVRTVVHQINIIKRDLRSPGRRTS